LQNEERINRTIRIYNAVLVSDNIL